VGIKVPENGNPPVNLFVLTGIAFGLAMDAFAVAIACSLSLRRVSRRQIFRLAFHFGLFQAMMPVIGWAAGQAAEPLIRDWDHWGAFGLLLFIGGKAIREALNQAPDGARANGNGGDPTAGLSLVFYSFATSIDALAVGLTLSMLRVNILYPAAVIGAVTMTVTAAGMILGSRLGARFGRRMEVLGGLILIAIGVKILLSHLN